MNENIKFKVLFVASEAAPYVKVGGLGEVMRSLPRALRELGHEVRVFLPKYATMKTENFALEPQLQNLPLIPAEKDPLGLLVSNVLQYRDPHGEILAYFLENMEYYEKRANVYGYNDDSTRWVLLSRGAIEFLKRSEWQPDLIVTNDWQTGFLPNLLKTEYKDDPRLAKIPVLFCIHNLKHQGMFDPNFVAELDYDSGQSAIPDFFDPAMKKLNGMRRGILYADVISTVSPTYAKEILLPENGVRLEEILRERRAHLYGILNGIDYEIYNPAVDKAIAARYGVRSLKNREKNKLTLQKRMGLPENPQKFLMAFVGRLEKQKGLDLLEPIILPLVNNIDFQLVIVGAGNADYKKMLNDFQEQYPERIAAHLLFDEEIPKMVFSGADAVLVPSRYEPSGLVQMEAMRYGAVPIVHKVGGLADSVADYSPENHFGTGFVFESYDPYALLIAILRAHETYRHRKEWQSLMKRAMNEDFSWQKSAREYVKLFFTTLEEKQKHSLEHTEATSLTTS